MTLYYGQPGWEWGIQQQVDMFDDYLADTAELHDRTRHHEAYSYDEREWEAFQYGWNAAKLHYNIK